MSNASNLVLCHFVSFNYILGVQVCAVALGSSINMNEINAMGSNLCTYKMPSYSTLSASLSNAISERVHLFSNPILPPNFFSGLSFGKRFLRLLKRRYDNSDKLE